MDDRLSPANCYRADGGRLVAVDCRTGAPVAGDGAPTPPKPRLSFDRLAALKAAPP